MSCLFTAYPARAEGLPVAEHPVISELQTGSLTSASEEFIELYNPTASDLSLDGWIIQYKSATSVDQPSSWSKRATLTGQLKAHGFYLVAPTTYLVEADAPLSTGLAGTGGHVRLVDAAATEIDRLGWGTANAAEGGHPAPAPAAGQSLERQPGRLVEEGGNGVDTDDNLADMVERATPLPQSTRSVLEIPAVAVAPAAEEVEPEVTPAEPAAEVEALPTEPLVITELLVNPAMPLVDAQDEFIELFNPNPGPVSLTGYVLRSGAGYHDYYVLPGGQIEPGAYLAIYSSQSHVSLTNTGGAAQLLDPAGQVVSETEPYPEAPASQSWAWFDSWEWTLQTTPGQANVFAPPLVLATASAAGGSPVKAKAAKKAKLKAAKPVKTRASKLTAAAKPKTTRAATAGTAVALVGGAEPGSKSGRWLLIGFLTFTIGYAIYEYRFDLRNYLQLARRHISLGRAARTTAPERGVPGVGERSGRRQNRLY